jgi:hypothetical protein
MLAVLGGLWVLLILAIIRGGYEDMKWEHEKQERLRKIKRE